MSLEINIEQSEREMDVQYSMAELSAAEIEEVSGACGPPCMAGLLLASYGAGLATGNTFWGD